MRYVSLMLVCMLMSCSSTSTPSATPTPKFSSLRIMNTSTYDLHQLVVIFPTQRIDFGDIPAGATSAYLPVTNGVYRYSAFKVEIDGKLYDQGVTDWMGEQPMPGYKLSYVLTVDLEGEALIIIGIRETLRDE